MTQHKKTTLPNGIRVITETIPYVKSFSLGFWFDTGSRSESLENNGISHFIEHMVFKGTTKRSAKKIATEIESCGGYLNAFTSKEHICFYGRGLIEHLEKTFDVISDMIQNPLFKNSDIKKESKVVIDELYDIEDNPEELIFDKFEEVIYSNTPLALPIIGSETNIKNFNQRALQAFVKNNFRFDNLVIAASGAIEHQEILKMADKFILKNLGNSVSKKKKLCKFSNLGYTKTIEKDIQQVHTIIGGTTYGYNSAERVIAALLMQILGEGSSSRLFQSVRERNGIAYQINSFLNSFIDVSSFGVYLSTNEKMIDKAVSLVKKEFIKLKSKKVSTQELNKAKESLKGNLLLSLESTTNRMIRMAQSELYFNRIKSVEEIIENINKVTANQIIELANVLFSDNNLVQIIIKSNNAILKSAA